MHSTSSGRTVLRKLARASRVRVRSVNQRVVNNAMIVRMVRTRSIDLNHRRIFCISPQKSGTTSFGDFCEHQLGLRRAGWTLSRARAWSQLWYEGRLERILRDPEFENRDAYEDGPWWFPGMAEILIGIFPNAKFVLFERDADDWFGSLVRHADGRSPGRSHIHAAVYGLQEEYWTSFLSGDMESRSGFTLESRRDWYLRWYRKRLARIKEVFALRAPDRLLVCRLDDADKWKRVAGFLGFDHVEPADTWSNSSDSRGAVR